MVVSINNMLAGDLGFLVIGHKALLSQLVNELAALGREDIMVVIGSVIPAQDYQYLYDRGAAAIFGPGTVIPIAAQKVLEELQQRLGLDEVVMG